MLNTAELMANDNVNDPLLSGFTCREVTTFDGFVALHQARIRHLVSAHLDSSDEADDLVQEVFMSALKNLKGFRGQGRLSGWLTQIAVNKCRSHWRKVGAQRKVLASAAKALEQSPPPEPEALAMERETFRRVRQAVQALPGHYRQVVVLRYLKQIPTGDVAEVLDVPAASVRSRLHRARKRLKGLLADIVKE